MESVLPEPYGRKFRGWRLQQHALLWGNPEGEQIKKKTTGRVLRIESIIYFFIVGYAANQLIVEITFLKIIFSDQRHTNADRTSNAIHQ